MTAGISTMNTDEPKRPLSRQEANRQGQGSPGPPSDGTTRTSGSDGRFCQECRAVIAGRREDDNRMDTVLAAGEAWFATLRAELRRRS